jgi:hypothetical protein
MIDFTEIVNKDMVDGTMNLLKTVWSLIGSVITEFGKSNSQVKNREQFKKIKDEMYNIRNKNLSMVSYLQLLWFD